MALEPDTYGFIAVLYLKKVIYFAALNLRCSTWHL